jgi:ubiquinone/menaquinone biosynthesis C-methylase UbiE
MKPDWDETGFTSMMPLRRYWHRRRFSIISEWALGKVLDVGCGSSVIVQKIPNSIGVDISRDKLDYLNGRGMPLIQADARSLPFRSDSFDTVISSQVIEHIKEQAGIFDEMRRVLKPRGRLIIGTPDYATLWRVIEPVYGICAPDAYRDYHVTRYTRKTLSRVLECFGFVIESYKYIAYAELIMCCRNG